MFAGWGRGALGPLSAGGNKLGSVAMSANSPPTSLYDDIYINPSAPLDDSDDMHTILGPGMSTSTAYRKCDSNRKPLHTL